jgi:peptide chain release factor 2
VQGGYAYGYLKKESGVHRLVRISPFSAQALRHTSFALVEVLPEISLAEEGDLEVKPEELAVEVCKASGPGGQNVNKRMTAVKITHLSTKITVASQTERSLAQNKESAMKMLYAKLYQLKESQREKELAKIKGKAIAIEWGSQIRSYVLHPYQLVKDVRTNVETSDTAGVLDGKLEKLISAEIKYHD